MLKFIIHIIFIFISLLIISCKNNDENRNKFVAIINDEKVYLEELDQFILQQLYDELNRIYTLRNTALDNLINQKLILQEAKKRNITAEAYLNNYIDSIIEQDSYDKLILKYKIDNDLKYIYNVNLLNIPSKTYEGRTLQNSRLKDILKNRLIDSLRFMSKIDKYLYPPQSPNLNSLQQHVLAYKGNKNSNVTMLLISDFDCGKCIEFHSIYDSIYNKYKDRVKFGYINFSAIPTTAIIASEAFNYQDKFWEFYNLAYARNEYIDSTKAFNIAKELNVDINKFQNDFNSKELVDKIENKFTALHQHGFYATPTIVINNRLLFNSGSYNEISELLNMELRK